VAHVQRQAQLGHVGTASAQDRRAARQELGLFEPCMRAMTAHQVFGGSAVDLGRLARRQPGQARLQAGPQPLHRAVFCGPLLHQMLYPAALLTRLGVGQYSGKQVFFLVHVVVEHGVLEELHGVIGDLPGARYRAKQRGQLAQGIELGDDTLVAIGENIQRLLVVKGGGGGVGAHRISCRATRPEAGANAAPVPM
jgi:hypothetical protein